MLTDRCGGDVVLLTARFDDVTTASRTGARQSRCDGRQQRILPGAAAAAEVVHLERPDERAANSLLAQVLGLLDTRPRHILYYASRVVGAILRTT